MIPHLNFHEIVEAEKTDFTQGIGHIVATEIKDRVYRNFNCGLICTDIVFEVYF